MAEWLEKVVDVAREAALADDRMRLGWEATDERSPPFAYRWEHVQLVVRNAIWLLGKVNGDHDVVLAAAWLHDVEKSKEDHARLGAEFAQEFLATTDFPSDKIDAVYDAIDQHAGLFRPAKRWHRSEPFRPAAPMTPVEAAILWDADKLAKIGPVALLHFAPYFLFDMLRKGQSTTTEEFHRKNQKWLRDVAPKILASFNTRAAQRRAMSLHAPYQSFSDTTTIALESMRESPPSPPPAPAPPQE